MVQSIDGSTVVDGRSAQLSSPTDTAVLARLRRLADVVIVGAGTVREESYGPPRKEGQRVGVVTASGDLDVSTPLFSCGAGFVITTDEPHTDPFAERLADRAVDVIRAGSGRVDLVGAIATIPSVVTGATFVQAEGGAALNASLMAADVVDEINLTTSPLVVGGRGPRLTAGADDLALAWDLVQLAVDDASFTFARWRRGRQRS
jgi:5-amino-6-(5-phosphoribosylamino)uracil reductase